AAIEGLGDRRCYAEILLAMAKTARYLPAGLSMGRPSMGPWRIQPIPSAAARTRRDGPPHPLQPPVMVAASRALSAVTIVQKAAVPETVTGLSSMPLDRYTGQFEISVIHVLTITQHGEELFAQLTGQPAVRLTAGHASEFADEPGDMKITFVPN